MITLLIARREITVRLQQKGFRIGLAVTLIVIALGAATPKIASKLVGDHGSGNGYTIGVSGAQSDSIAAALKDVAGAQNEKVSVRPVGTAQAEHEVRSGAWDAAVVDGGRIVAKSADSGAVALIQAAHQALTVQQNLTQDGLTADQVKQAFNVTDLQVDAVQTDTSPQDSQRQAVSSIAVVFLFAQLITFCSWVGIGVVEEKASRVVEVILSSARPVQLMAGKLLGIGALAMAQALVLALTGVGVGIAVGSLSLPAGTYVSLLIAFAWFLLGFVFFASLSAGLASLVSRQEEVSAVLTPVTGLLFVSYAASFSVASDPDSGLSRVLSLIPPISAISMPARLARGGVGVVDVLLAALLMLALSAAAIVVAARLYRAAILQTGNKLSLRAAWRSEAVADLD